LSNGFEIIFNKNFIVRVEVDSGTNQRLFDGRYESNSCDAEAKSETVEAGWFEKSLQLTIKGSMKLERKRSQ